MGGLLTRIRGMLGGDSSPSQDSANGGERQGGVDPNLALQFTLDRWNDLKNAYVVYHQSIWEALLFYANQSWVDWDDARKVWQPQQPSDAWVPRPRINRFSPSIDAVASNFFQLPEVEAVAKDTDTPQSQAIADICTSLIEYAVVKEGLKHQQNEEPDKVGLAAQLFVLTGSCFSLLRVSPKSLGQQAKQGMQPAYGYQCPTCDKYSTVPAGEGSEPPKFCPECASPVGAESTQTLQPEVDETGAAVMEEMQQNEISCEIGNALFAFPRPGATSMANSPYFLWAQRRTLDDIWFRWNFEAQPDSVWPDGYSVTYEHALNFWYTGYSNTTLQVKDSCMVLEMFVAPNKVKDHPQGFHSVAINDKPVAAEMWNWDYPEHPVTMAKYLDLPTIFFARSVAFDLVELQRELNAYESLIKLHAMVNAVDPWVVDNDSVVSEITGRADKIIKYKRASPDTEPPHRAGHGQLDDGVYKQRESIHGEFQNISMAVNAFRGQQEGGVTAAAAIQQLRGQAELMFSKPAMNWRNFWRETMRKYVMYLQKFYSQQQLAEILGKDREEDIRQFLSADLAKIVDWVASDHGLPRTRDELRQEMMTMFQAGALDVTDPSVQQKIHELFGETGLKEAFFKNATNARLENMAFEQGTAGPGEPYAAPDIQPQPVIEDLQVHLYFHKDQAISQDFKKWRPQAQQALIEHIMETQQAIAATMPPPAPLNLKPPPQLIEKNTQGQNPALGQPTPTAPAPPGLP